MTLKSEMESDVKDVFLNEDEFAVQITYLPKDGTAPADLVTCSAIVDPVIDAVTNKVVESKQRLMVALDDIDEPEAGATGTVDGRAYRVLQVEQGAPGAAILLVDLRPTS